MIPSKLQEATFKSFKGLLHCFSTFSRKFPDQQVFIRETDC